MHDTDFTMGSLSPLDSRIIFPDICWDKKAGNLYGAKIEGSIAVYDKSIIGRVELE